MPWCLGISAWSFSMSVVLQTLATTNLTSHSYSELKFLRKLGLIVNNISLKLPICIEQALWSMLLFCVKRGIILQWALFYGKLTCIFASSTVCYFYQVFCNPNYLEYTSILKWTVNTTKNVIQDIIVINLNNKL